MKHFFLSLFLCALVLSAGCGRDRAVVYSLEYADTGLSGGAEVSFGDRIVSASESSGADLSGTGSQGPETDTCETGRVIATRKLVNINTADEAELMSLKGVGRVRAAAIIEYREKCGEFGAIEDIMNVSGIKEGTFAKIRDSITVH
ncbi:MAG: ComEA family DNA-binding protein [Lachnospiraceae bacterium]|nr:ComEA family DNA-binding protein [Lachnospiraceae bacterium]